MPDAITNLLVDACLIAGMGVVTILLGFIASTVHSILCSIMRSENRRIRKI